MRVFFPNETNEIRSFGSIKNLVSINKISGSRQGISIISLVSDKKITKNKNILLEVEDLTGKIKVLKAEILGQTKVGPFGVPGKTFLAPDDKPFTLKQKTQKVKGKIAVQTGKDFLIITRLQLEGKKAVSSEDFLRGHQNFIGTVLK